MRYVGQFAKHFGVSPDQLGAEHIRTYQLHLLQKKASKSLFIQTVCALRFLYETTLDRPWMVADIPYPKKPKTLPVILSRDEVQALIRARRQRRHQPRVLPLLLLQPPASRELRPEAAQQNSV